MPNRDVHAIADQDWRSDLRALARGPVVLGLLTTVFGGGLVIGNIVGGKLADRNLEATLIGTLLALALVLGLMTFAVHDQIAMVIFVGLLGVAAFATVPPLQMWALEKSNGAGQSLASSFNIGAFNLGNAAGAWLGGMVIDHGPGLPALPWVAALLPLLGAALAWKGLRSARIIATACEIASP